MAMIKDLKTRLFALMFVCFLCGVTFLLVKRSGLDLTLDDITGKSMERLHAGMALENEGRRLAEAGQFEAALEKYKEAIEPQYVRRSYQRATAMGAMISIYCVLQQYDLALEAMEWFFLNARDNVPTPFAIERKKEIQVLKNYHEDANKSRMLVFINEYLDKHKMEFPPSGYDSAKSAAVLRLFNTVGEHDKGIALIDEVLFFLKERRKAEGKEDYTIYDRIKTVEQATECMKVGPRDNPDWHGCKFLRQYYLVREAFEQDKADGFTGCAGSPPGQVCMGKATKAIIQSDYFPW